MLEPQSLWALHVFHTFSGCHITLSSMDYAGHPFLPLEPDDDHFLGLERLTAILYDNISPMSSVNDIRIELFCHVNRSMTNDALLQNSRRAVYQTGIWAISAQTQLVVPSAQDFDWTKVSESRVPVCMTIPEVSRPCHEPIKCSFKGDCSNCNAQSESELLTTLQLKKCPTPYNCANCILSQSR